MVKTELMSIKIFFVGNILQEHTVELYMFYTVQLTGGLCSQDTIWV